MKTYSYNENYQDSFMTVINNAINEFPRTFALRVDLRFPTDYIYGQSSKYITRFIESLKSKLKFDVINKNSKWNREFKNRLRYIWVREFGVRSRRKHYHVVLFLNKDIYYSLGLFSSDSSLASLIQQAWCSALNIDHIVSSYLVHFPEKGTFYLCNNDDYIQKKIISLKERIDYLAKDYTKVYGDGYRSIGMSRN
ncbi:TPA: inovirus Gp2 family protein [Proteus mirabilis]